MIYFEPLPGVAAAGQPDAEALEMLAQSGFVGVVDLRGPAEPRGLEEKDAVEALGMAYTSLPIADGADLSYENAAALDRILADANGPVLVHCGSAQRVGALLALRERLNGASAESALAIGRAGGLTSPALAAAVVEKLAER